MRISTSMMMKKYAEVLNNKYGDINKYANQISTTRAFSTASENPVAAMQTIKSCHEYTENQQYQNNVSQAKSWIQATETTVTEINDILKAAKEKATEMLNGTNSADDYKNYAVAMMSYRDEIVSTLNTSFGGQYIFGGSTKGPAPFKLDDDGNLMYYDYNAPTPGYVNINTLTKTDVENMKVTSPIDIGIGLTKTGSTLDKNSYFERATSGLSVIISDYSGAGETAGNIVDNLTAIINALNSNNPDQLNNALSNIQNAQDAVLKVKVELGEKTNMLKAVESRLTNNESNIINSLANSMEVDAVEAILNLNISQVIYKESMSVASSILQQSLIDFLD